MLVLRIIGALIALAMAGAAVLAIIYASTMWTVIWTVGALSVGALSLVRHKNPVHKVVND